MKKRFLVVVTCFLTIIIFLLVFCIYFSHSDEYIFLFPNEIDTVCLSKILAITVMLILLIIILLLNIVFIIKFLALFLCILFVYPAFYVGIIFLTGFQQPEYTKIYSPNDSQEILVRKTVYVPASIFDIYVPVKPYVYKHQGSLMGAPGQNFENNIRVTWDANSAHFNIDEKYFGQGELIVTRNFGFNLLSIFIFMQKPE